MGIRTTDDVVEFFADRIEAHPDDLPSLGSFARVSSMSVNGDRIIHYGHFDLAQIVRDKRGHAKLVVLNGDRWGGPSGFGPSTSSRQAQVRQAVERTGVYSIIVPVTALAAAGIAPGDIEPIDVRDDRHETEHRSSSTKPGKEHVMMPCPEGRTAITSLYVSGTHDCETGSLYRRREGGWEEWPQDATVPEDVVLHDEQPFPDEPSILDDEGGWRAWRDRWSQYHGRQVPGRVPLKVPNPERVYVGRSKWQVAELGEDGIWRWEVEHHFLGDSLFRARLRERVNVKPTPEQVAAFERHRHAASMATSLREHLFDENRAGRNWDDHEQGELFPGRRHRWHSGYAVPRSPEMIAELEREAEHWNDEVEAAWRAFTPLIPRGQDAMTSRDDRLVIQRTRRRTAYFLSSFDYQESTPLYFLCELPRGARPTTVEEAIDCLKPPEVVAAEARGLQVTRQGDLFAIPTRLTKRQIRRMLRRTGFQKRLRVLGTNHSVTEGVMCKGGAVLGRGVMRHEPDGWRGADHKPQRMGDGKTWHLLVRNTVPRQ